MESSKNKVINATVETVETIVSTENTYFIEVVLSNDTKTSETKLQVEDRTHVVTSEKSWESCLNSAFAEGRKMVMGSVNDRPFLTINGVSFSVEDTIRLFKKPATDRLFSLSFGVLAEEFKALSVDLENDRERLNYVKAVDETGESDGLIAVDLESAKTAMQERIDNATRVLAAKRRLWKLKTQSESDKLILAIDAGVKQIIKEEKARLLPIKEKMLLSYRSK